MPDDQALRVLFLASEADPLIKVGGLGDVAGSLPRSLRSLSGRNAFPGEVDVRLAIPLHGQIHRDKLALEPVTTFAVQNKDGPLQVEVLSCEMSGVPVYLIAAPLITGADAVYHNDASLDGPKYTLFSLAALELARKLGWAPDVVHANDWHTALSVYALERQRQTDAFFHSTASLMGVHNLPYLGIGAGDALQDFGLPPAAGSRLPRWAQNLPLPLGLLAADAIVAPSPSYAREILTQEFGSGLVPFLSSRAGAIHGILNGINTETWDPETDPHIPQTYQQHSLERRLDNKAALLQETGQPQDLECPLLTMITRMDPQKGVDLVPDALREIEHLPWRAILLGTGQPDVEAAVLKLQTDYPDRVRAFIRYDAGFSHRLYAGADILLMPSRYEPCGLNQMIAMRYGCVPVARAVGGLRDTVQDHGQAEESTGFLFEEATPSALAAALTRALSIYAKRADWQALQRRGMQQDFSWERSAAQYLDLYQRLARARTKVRPKTGN